MDSTHTEAPRLVGTKKALEIIFDEEVRPGADYLRRAAIAGRIHSLRVGRKLVFDVETLRADLRKEFQNSIPTI